MPTASVEIEAHILQSGKLLRRPGGEIAKGAEYQITRKSRGCPPELEPVARPTFWFPNLSYPDEIFGAGSRAEVIAGRAYRDPKGRGWWLFANITRAFEGGADGTGRPYVQLRVIAVPTATARPLWSLSADVLEHLGFEDDLAGDDEAARFHRDTGWIAKSAAAIGIDQTGLLPPGFETVDEAARALDRLLQLPDASGRLKATPIELPLGERTPTDFVWALALVALKRGCDRVPFVIGLTASALGKHHGAYAVAIFRP